MHPDAKGSIWTHSFRHGLETIYGERIYRAKRNETTNAKESRLTQSHTEAGEKLVYSQQQLLTQRHLFTI